MISEGGHGPKGPRWGETFGHGLKGPGWEGEEPQGLLSKVQGEGRNGGFGVSQKGPKGKSLTLGSLRKIPRGKGGTLKAVRCSHFPQLASILWI